MLESSHYIAFIKSRIPSAWEHDESQDDYLKRHGIAHFTYGETLRLKRAGLVAPDPPAAWMPRAVPGLWFAEALRSALSARVGRVVPISIGNGFRPSPVNKDLRGYPDLNARVGGAKRSTHITYCAFDLDPSDDASIKQVREEAARIFVAVKDYCVIGMGFYRWSKRIHVDIGRGENVGIGSRVRNAIWGESRQYLKGVKIR